MMCNLCKLTEKRKSGATTTATKSESYFILGNTKKKIMCSERQRWMVKERDKERIHLYKSRKVLFFQMPNDVYQRYNESNHTKLISKFRCSSKMQETVKWLLTNAAFSLSLPLVLSLFLCLSEIRMRFSFEN